MWNMYNFHFTHFCELTYIKLNIFNVAYMLSSSVGLTLCDPTDCSPPGFSVHRFPSWNTGMGCHFPLKTQGLNPCLLHWQMDTLPLSHLGYPHVVKRSLQTQVILYVFKDICCYISSKTQCCHAEFPCLYCALLSRLISSSLFNMLYVLVTFAIV